MRKVLIALVFCSGTAYADEMPNLKPENQAIFNNFVKTMIDDEISVFAKGGDSRFDIQTVTASELISAYQKNELAANKKYKGKAIRLMSVASSINEDAMKNAYITANGNKSYEQVMLYVNANDDRVLNLSKKDKIDFVCIGDGFLLGSPILKKCEFSTDYIKAKYLKTIESASKASDDGYKPKYKTEALMLGLYNALGSNIANGCSSAGDACKKAVTSAIAADKSIKEKLEPYKTYFKDLPEY